MQFSNIVGIASLTGRGTPQRTKVSGSVQIGEATRAEFPENTYIVWRKLKMYGLERGRITFDPLSTEVETAYTPAIAQVETATAEGTITAAGNATVTVTGNPLPKPGPTVISVPVALNDTASAWAAKVRTALAAHPDIAEYYTVSGSGTSIVLSRILRGPGGHPNDSSLNIALANGTCTGIVTASTSANTTAGVGASGAQWDTSDSFDTEGFPFPSDESKLTVVTGLYIRVTDPCRVFQEDAVTTKHDWLINANSTMLILTDDLDVIQDEYLDIIPQSSAYVEALVGVVVRLI